MDWKTGKVTFKKTGLYGCGPANHDDVYTIDEFKEHCQCGAFIDYDGSGYPVKDNIADMSFVVRPSRYKDIPKEFTHVVWFNK